MIGVRRKWSKIQLINLWKNGSPDNTLKKRSLSEEDDTSVDVDDTFADIDDKIKGIQISTPNGKNPPISPTVSRLVGTSSSSYFGYLEFINTKTTFDFDFVIESIILGIQPASKNSVDWIECGSSYVDTCMMDVFLDICCEDYVRVVDSGSNKKLVYVICKSVLDILQEYTTLRQ